MAIVNASGNKFVTKEFALTEVDLFEEIAKLTVCDTLIPDGYFHGCFLI
jgi:hypothetical protein